MKTIIVQPTGGLCNRMRTIASAVQLSQKLNCKIKVLWVKDPTLNAPFNSLFDGFPYPVIETTESSFSHRLFSLIYKRIKHYMLLDQKWIENKARGKDESLWINEIKDKNIYIEACSDIYKDSGVYDIFKPKSSIQNKVISNCSEFIGLHIRRSDNEMSIKYSPTKLFLDVIEKEIAKDSAVKFYLATDDLQEEKTISERFGDRIFTYKKRSVDRNTEVGIVDAMIDLTNLASCRKIYGSYYSSFSDVAAIWGNTEKKVIKIAD